MYQLPSKIERILHRHIHTLTGFGRVGVARIACSKYTWVAVYTISHVIKSVGDAVTNVVDRPPHHLFHIQRIGPDDAIGRSDHVVLRQLAMRCFFIRTQFV